MPGRGSLKSAAQVGFLHSLPISQGGRIAAITRGSDPRNSGSNPGCPAKFARVVKLDWRHATNVERCRFESCRGYQVLFWSSNGQETSLRSSESRFDPAPERQSLGISAKGRLRRCLRHNRSSILRIPAKFMPASASGRRPDSHSGNAVSITAAGTKFYGVEHDWSSALSFKEVTVGSLPTYATNSGSET